MVVKSGPVDAGQLLGEEMNRCVGSGFPATQVGGGWKCGACGKPFKRDELEGSSVTVGHYGKSGYTAPSAADNSRLPTVPEHEPR